MQLEYGGQRLTIAAGELVIGSDPDATLRLAGPSVLPRHAVLRLAKNAHPVILPAAQDAVVEVNGTRIGREPTPLMHGDRIAIGEQEIRVSDPSQGGETRVFSAVASDEAKSEAVASGPAVRRPGPDRKSTRLNSSHMSISYAVFCLKKKKKSH